MCVYTRCHWLVMVLDKINKQANIHYSIIFSVIGSGKSCTMYGHGNDMGLLKRCIDHLLNASHKISFQMVEIYGSKIFDCIDLNKADITSGNGKKASKIAIQSSEQFDATLQSALQKRTQKSTNQNQTSSRSHAITKIMLDDLQGCLLFVDLAGFENIDGKENRQETLFINQSLLELNKVLLALSRNEMPIYTSALTKYFQPQFVDGDIVMLYHLHAKSVEGMKSGLGYIKELTCKCIKKKKIAKSIVKQLPASNASATKSARQRLVSLNSRIAKYQPQRI